MSILFAPHKLGSLLLRNRFVHSACEDNLADTTGIVTEANVRRVRTLAKGEIGLIIWTHLAVHPLGRTKLRQAGIFNDDMMPGLRKVVSAVHDYDGRIAFQLGHAGIQTAREIIGGTPLGPHNATEDDIQEVVSAFVEAAVRGVEAGADAVQLHAAHGYLINQFLSPGYNQRTDDWGETDENRFRFLREIILQTQEKIAGHVPLLVKLNADDHIARTGITPSLAARYAKWLAELDIDGLEVSSGSSFRSPWAICRGDIPYDEILAITPASRRDLMESWLESTLGDYGLTEAYNLGSTKLIRAAVGRRTSLFAVGGWRSLSRMEYAVRTGETDFISMCRPFLREPHLVRQLKDGRMTEVSCKSCNLCFAAITTDMPVRCYYRRGLPGDTENGGTVAPH